MIGRDWDLLAYGDCVAGRIDDPMADVHNSVMNDKNLCAPLYLATGDPWHQTAPADGPTLLNVIKSARSVRRGQYQKAKECAESTEEITDCDPLAIVEVRANARFAECASRSRSPPANLVSVEYIKS